MTEEQMHEASMAIHSFTSAADDLWEAVKLADNADYLVANLDQLLAAQAQIDKAISLLWSRRARKRNEEAA